MFCSKNKFCFCIKSIIIFFVFFINTPSIHAAVINASGLLGQLDGSNNPIWTQNIANNNAGSINAKGFNGLISLAIDTVNHRLFVSDTLAANNRILVFSLDSANNIVNTTPDFVLGACDFTTAGSGALTSSTFRFSNLVYDSVNARLFVSDYYNNRVLAFNVAPSVIRNCEEATFVLGQPDFTTSDTSTISQNRLIGPDNVDYDFVNERLFVSDGGPNRVMAFSVPANATSSINGENALFVLGQPNFTSNNRGTTQNEFNNLYGQAYDSVNERLFVSDSDNNRVLAFSVPANATSSINGENAIFVLGQPDFTTSSVALTQNGLNKPDDINYDTVGNRLFVSDRLNHRIMVFSVPANATSSINGENAQNNIGQATWISNSSGTSQSAMFSPEPPHAYDPVNNRLYVYEIYKHRVLQFNMINITTASLSSATVNTPYSAAISITANQGTSQTYSIASGSLLSGLSLNSSTGVISGTPTTAETTTVTIKAEDNFSTGPFFDLATYTMRSLSAEAQITSFNLSSPATTGVINQTSHTVSLSVPYGTNVNNLNPIIVVSTGATISPASGIAGNFSTPQTYTVTAEDNSTQAYTITVTVAADTTPPTTASIGGGNAMYLIINSQNKETRIAQIKQQLISLITQLIQLLRQQVEQMR